MSYMSPEFVPITVFNQNHTSHTHYSLHLYREENADRQFDANGIPVIFIPGNAGSYRQVRALASASSLLTNSILSNNPHTNNPASPDKIGFDYFTVDFQEDLTALHGQALYNQAEYLNDAVKFILEQYYPSHAGPKNFFPLPKSIILIGHSMGGVVARTMLTLDNYKQDSVNTIFTLAAPHTLPPVAFDPTVARIYDSVNRYWEQSFSQDLIGRNPLASVAVISIAGGSLDHMIPSELTSLAATIPPSNGFTVHSHSIPHVWMGIDHQAIVWSDQFRKVFARAILEIVNIASSQKTKSLPERMSVFRKHFLGGYNSPDLSNYIHEKYHPTIGGSLNNNNESTFMPPRIGDPDTLLWVDKVNPIPINQKFFLNKLGSASPKKTAHIIALPSPNFQVNHFFSLITDNHLLTPVPASTENLDENRPHNLKTGQVLPGLYAMACRYESKSHSVALNVIDLTDKSTADDTNLVGLLCKNIADDCFKLPRPLFSHTKLSPPSEHDYYSYFRYGINQLKDYDFIAIIDNNEFPTPGFVSAEFSSKYSASVTVKNPLRDFIHGVTVSLRAHRPTVVDISYTSLWSSLLAFKATITEKPRTTPLLGYTATDSAMLPFIRQYSGDNYDSKYYLNVGNGTQLDVSMYGVAPFTPFGVRAGDSTSDVESNLFYFGQTSHYYHNLHLQVWSEPSASTGAGALQITLKLDILASAGKLLLHYRVGVVILPVAVALCSLALQLRIYAITGQFVSFSRGLRAFSSTLLGPIGIAATVLPVLFESKFVQQMLFWLEPDLDYLSGDGPVSIFSQTTKRNPFLLGLEPGHIWYLGALFVVVALGICCIVNYLLVGIVSLLGFFLQPNAQTPLLSSLTLRLMLVWVLVFCVVSLGIPSEAVFVTSVLLQLVQAIHREPPKGSTNALSTNNNQNYIFSLLVLMLLLAPIPAPTLIAYFRSTGAIGFSASTGHQLLSNLGLSLLSLAFCVNPNVPPALVGAMSVPVPTTLSKRNSSISASPSRLLQTQIQQWLLLAPSYGLFGWAAYTFIFGLVKPFMVFRLFYGFAAWNFISMCYNQCQ